jgi:hypothetical protein
MKYYIINYLKDQDRFPFGRMVWYAIEDEDGFYVRYCYNHRIKKMTDIIKRNKKHPEKQYVNNKQLISKQDYISTNDWELKELSKDEWERGLFLLAL